MNQIRALHHEAELTNAQLHLNLIFHQSNIIIFCECPVNTNLKFESSSQLQSFIKRMKAFLLLALLCAFSLQQAVLLSSNTSNTIILSPANYVPVIEAYHTTNNPNYIGYNAQWIYKNGSGSWPVGDNATFVAVFYADCQSTATLLITADNVFSANLNGGAAMTGNSWFQVYKFTINNLKCGANVLVINVTNKDAGSPAALIFAIVQDQSKCYICSSPLSYWNKGTCKCQCLGRCNCRTTHPSYVWNDYPICGCKCNKTLSCPINRYFDPNTCACQCNHIACLPGYVQNSDTCLCTKRCRDVINCADNKVWNPTLCQCVCKTILKCVSPLVWNSALCACEKIIIQADVANSTAPAKP